MASKKLEAVGNMERSDALTADADSPRFVERVGVVHAGQTYNVREDALMDARVARAFERGQVFSGIEMVIGADGVDRLFASIAEEDGFVPQTGVEAFAKVLIETLDPKAVSAP